MSKLEDLLGKKKEVVPVLDLSKTIVNTKEEYKRLCEKVPDYKMRPIKVRKTTSNTNSFQKRTKTNFSLQNMKNVKL